jgi:SPP1 gp7 family putative phage head morphogenesis protein
MARPKSVQDELDDLLNRAAFSFRRVMADIGASYASGDNDHERHIARLRVLLAETQALADLYGRRRVLLWGNYAQDRVAASARDEIYCAAFTSPIVPHVPFREAIEDFKRRVPTLADTAEAVAAVYRRSPATAFAAARATLTVARKVQNYIAQAMQSGKTADQARDEIAADAGDWTKAYAENVYRTNVHNAYSAGEIKQGLEPVTLEIMPAWQFSSVGDSNTRPNHQAGSGFLAAKRDPRWAYMYTPLGYQCRCWVRDVDVFELEQRGLLTLTGEVRPVIPPRFSEAGPDRGFGGVRPDMRIYR